LFLFFPAILVIDLMSEGLTNSMVYRQDSNSAKYLLKDSFLERHKKKILMILASFGLMINVSLITAAAVMEGVQNTAISTNCGIGFGDLLDQLDLCLDYLPLLFSGHFAVDQSFIDLPS